MYQNFPALIWQLEYLKNKLNSADSTVRFNMKNNIALGSQNCISF